jgi:helix-turn-helix protein
MNTAQAKQLIEEKEDFVYSKRFEYSLKKVMERYPDGCPDRIIAAVLLITEDEVQEIYETVVNKLRIGMGVVLPEESSDGEWG